MNMRFTHIHMGRLNWKRSFQVLKIYKRRPIIESSFAWIKNKPIINQNYQKTISSYDGLLSLMCSLIISNRI